MEDWSNYAKTVTDAKTSTGETPKVGGYILIKITDNFIVVGLVILMVAFAVVGIFFADDTEKINWTLHASELCLGVFLGLITGKYKKNKE